MDDFLFAVIFPPFLGAMVILGCIGLVLLTRAPGALSRSFLKHHFLRIWRLSASTNIGIDLLLEHSPAGLIGSIISLAICLLLDDDMRKRGRKAAKLLGDKTRRIFESMRERMRVLEPLPGLTSFR